MRKRGQDNIPDRNLVPREAAEEFVGHDRLTFGNQAGKEGKTAYDFRGSKSTAQGLHVQALVALGESLTSLVAQ